jgi:peptide/nickel transport system substrate-binding protein
VIRRGRGPGPYPRALVLLGLCVVLITGCTPNATGVTTTPVTLVTVPGGAITVGIGSAPTGCNPNSASGDTWADQFVLGAVLPSTFNLSSSGNAVGNQEVISQAELVSTKPQTIVYTINPKAVWSDGVPITGADFLYAWQQQRGGAGTGPAASTLGYRDISSVTASNGGRTVTVVFKTGFADWRMLFDDLLPAHVMDKAGWNSPCATLDPSIDLSGGPFIIHSVTPGRQVVLTVNPRWWGPEPNLTRLTVDTMTTAGLASALRSGRMQVVATSTYDAPFIGAITDDPTAYSETNISSTFLTMEFSQTDSLTSSLVVREALAYAIDRQALINSVAGWSDSNIVPGLSNLYSQNQDGYPNVSIPAGEPNALLAANDTAVPTTTTTVPPVQTNAFPGSADLQATSQLLSANGFRQGSGGQWLDSTGAPVDLRLAVDEADPWCAQAGELVKDQLQAAGFEVKLIAEPTLAAAGMDLADDTANLAVLALFSSPYPSQAVAWYSQSLGQAGTNGSEDWSNYDNAAFDALLTKAEAQLNPVTAQPIYMEADADLWADMVALPLFAEPTSFAWSIYTSGVSPDPYGPNLLNESQSWATRIVQATNSTSTTSKG